MDDMCVRFNRKLTNIMVTKKANSCFLTKEKYDEMLKNVRISKNKTSGKVPQDYQRLKRYDIIKIGDVEKLIFPIRKGSCEVKFYVYFEELFNIIHEAHLSIGHGGRNRMVKELQKKYKNITAEEVMLYLSLCESCQKKTKKGLVRPMLSQERESRCQVDIIDMQSEPDDKFRFIFVYQDCLTKFVQLRAMKSKSPEEVANHLIDVFTIIGAPNVVQSNYGREFSSRVVRKARSMWPELKIVHGTSGLMQTQGSDKRASEDIGKMLSSWLETHKTKSWSKGLCFVQLMKNKTLQDGLKHSPFEAMFGRPLKLGLRTSFPNDAVEHLETEEELQGLIESVKIVSKKGTKHESDVDINDPLKIKIVPQVKVEIQSEDEAENNLNVDKRSLSDEESLDGQKKLKVEVPSVNSENLLVMTLGIKAEEENS